MLALLYGIFWYQLRNGVSGVWRTPGDLWGTFLSAVQLVHGHPAGMYTRTTGLVTFPAITYLLAPVAAVCSAMHLTIGPPAGPYWAPTAWFLVEPVEMAAASVVLFGADGCAEAFGASRATRWVLAFSEALVLGTVTALWGHPEDAVSVGLVLYAGLSADRSDRRKAAWLLGAAIAFQPLAVLAVPIVLARFELSETPRLLLALLLPSALLLAAPLVASPAAVWHAVYDQPNYPVLNHATPLTSFAPRSGPNGALQAGPTRLMVTALAMLAGFWVRGAKPRLCTVLAVVAAVLSVRLALEVTLTGFYIWPVLALVIVLASRRGAVAVLLATAASIGLAWFDQTRLGGLWGWWGVTVGGAAVLVALVSVPGSSGLPLLSGRRAGGFHEGSQARPA